MEEKKTISDICKDMAVSRQTVNNWRDKGYLVGSVENGLLVFSVDEINSLSKKRMPRGRRRRGVDG